MRFPLGYTCTITPHPPRNLILLNPIALTILIDQEQVMYTSTLSSMCLFNSSISTNSQS